jgi:hypothetical protein
MDQSRNELLPWTDPSIWLENGIKLHSQNHPIKRLKADSRRMHRPTEYNKKSVLLNLFLFSFFYFGLILTERQVIKQGLLDIQLPFQLDLLATLAGLIIGSGIIILLSAVFNKNQHYLRILLVSLLLAGAILCNQHINRKIFYPPYSTFPYGDIDKLGKKRWSHDYTYAMYSAMYDKYYLQTVVVNPEIETLDELKRIERFGITVKESSQAPTDLSSSQFDMLEKTFGDSYLLITREDLEYRLYDLPPPGILFLTRYKDMILFVPENLFAE